MLAPLSLDLRLVWKRARGLKLRFSGVRHPEVTGGELAEEDRVVVADTAAPDDRRFLGIRY